jgi:hypothetical protein
VQSVCSILFYFYIIRLYTLVANEKKLTAQAHEVDELKKKHLFIQSERSNPLEFWVCRSSKQNRTKQNKKKRRREEIVFNIIFCTHYTINI